MKTSMRDQIVGEIQRLALQQDGTPPGKLRFEKETGISEGMWRGVYWEKWSDATKEAGFQPNARPVRIDGSHIIPHIIRFIQEIGKFPTGASMKLRRKTDPLFPNYSTIQKRFPNTVSLVAAVREYATANNFPEIIQKLPISEEERKSPTNSVLDEFVYLRKFANYYKIGRTNDLKRRDSEIGRGLPERYVRVHEIKTDDASGVECYWHRRFASRLVKDEWFDLKPADIQAFKRWKKI